MARRNAGGEAAHVARAMWSPAPTPPPWSRRQERRNRRIPLGEATTRVSGRGCSRCRRGPVSRPERVERAVPSCLISVMAAGPVLPMRRAIPPPSAHDRSAHDAWLPCPPPRTDTGLLHARLSPRQGAAPPAGRSRRASIPVPSRRTAAGRHSRYTCSSTSIMPCSLGLPHDALERHPPVRSPLPGRRVCRDSGIGGKRA